MSRLTIDLSENQHQSLKAMAALQGKTIRQYALEKLFPENDEQEGWTADEKAAWKELTDMLETRAEEALNGHVSPRTAEEIIEAAIGRAKAKAVA